ncbi:MAG TPA: hypothetical protein VK769_00190, partial [Verrucomicrobiae bacterium]|nr:hypothetical protein [Verrucomicrobiae bacterium]
MFFPSRKICWIVALLALALPVVASTQLNLQSLGAVAVQSSGTSLPASRAIDGNTSTFSQTLNQSNGFWEVSFNRRVQLSKIQLTSPAPSV